MQKLYACLEKFVRSHTQSNYALKGFGHFREDVIYMDALPSTQMAMDVQELMLELHKIPALTFDEFDNGSDFHATVVMSTLKPFDYKEIWNYLEAGPQPNFQMSFDNIAVLKRDADKWAVERVFELPTG